MRYPASEKLEIIRLVEKISFTRTAEVGASFDAVTSTSL